VTIAGKIAWIVLAILGAIALSLAATARGELANAILS
jgi:hypothetical protein